MKVFEIINLNRGLLDVFVKIGIHAEDVKYVELYKDYIQMRRAGDKVSYVVAILAERYGVSERKVYALIKRFETDCNIFAVEGAPFI